MTPSLRCSVKKASPVPRSFVASAATAAPASITRINFCACRRISPSSLKSSNLPSASRKFFPASTKWLTAASSPSKRSASSSTALAKSSLECGSLLPPFRPVLGRAIPSPTERYRTRHFVLNFQLSTVDCKLSPMPESSQQQSWLNRTVLGVGLTSLFSDWSHETATAVLPAFLAAIGAGPAWLGAIEGIADGLSSFAKLAAGHYTDRLKRRKPLAVFGYAFTALATASFAFATHAYHVLFGRVAAWLGRGVRSPAKKALLAADVPPKAYGRAFGFERLMDTVGAIAGPLTALWLLEATGHSYRKVFLWTLLPGLVAVAAFWLLVRERPIAARPQRSFILGLKALPLPFRRLLVGVGVFGAGDFSHTLLILYATRMLAPGHGMARAASLAVGLYTLHNVFYAGSAYLSGWLSDHVPSRKTVLAAGYALAGVTALLLCTGTHSLWLLAI